MAAQTTAGPFEYEPSQIPSSLRLDTRELSNFGVTTKGHVGVVPGYSAQLQWYPDLEYEVVVLSNFGDTAAHIVAQHIEDLVTDL